MHESPSLWLVVDGEYMGKAKEPSVPAWSSCILQVCLQ